MLEYVLLIVGFALLVKGADFFVDGSSSVARLLKIPSLIIGLTIVAMGTSLPEASVSVTAAMAGQNELSLSNVIGSNIFNLLVVVGACAIIKPMSVQKSILKKEYPFSIIITVILLLFSLDILIFSGDSNIISRVNGIVLLVLFVVFIIITVKSALDSRNHSSSEADAESENKVLSPIKSVIYIILGMIGIIIGGNLVVDSATVIAETFGLSETLIGLTVVALGTSLPELVTSCVAATKGESDLALGNVVGSNIFNILFVLGMSASIHPVTVSGESIYDLIVLIISSILVYGFCLTKKVVNRIEGIIMVVIYICYTYYIIIR